MFIIYDTETTGLPKNWKAPLTDTDNWPRVIQLAWQLHEANGKLLSTGNLIVKPDGFEIPFNASKVHGITTEKAMAEGIPLLDILQRFLVDLSKAQYIGGHNIEFDLNVLGCEMVRMGLDSALLTDLPALDTMKETINFCALPGGRGGQFKWPTLIELHQKLFGEGFDAAHDAAFDVHATTRCFFRLLENGILKPGNKNWDVKIKYEAPLLGKTNFDKASSDILIKPEKAQADRHLDHAKVLNDLAGFEFVHLHCHSGFSVLQSTSDVEGLVAKASSLDMKALAITDFGNLMGAFVFTKAAKKAGIKAIVGCEMNVCRDHRNKTEKDDGFQIVLLAKNKKGYANLVKLSSKAHTDGFYYVPRIDKELLLEFKEDLIVLTGGLWGEIPYLILNEGESAAEESLQWWKEHFGENLFAEINRHGVEEEDVVNEVLIKLARKYDVKIVAANNTFYTEQTEASAQDVLLCIKDGENQSTPKKYIGKRGREFRFGLPNEEFYFKSADEMKSLFADLPDAIANTAEIAEKCEAYTLDRSILLPAFNIPQEFVSEQDREDGGKRGENAYLRHLSFEGALKRYGQLTPELESRINFELQTIEATGYPGYFLIVSDFCEEARKMGVSVGPGRGSAAGSVVAYCLNITNVDPIEYNLLFERFLNPDRKSMPDIDIDFDDEGRDKVIQYVINKYGQNQVAQIITYGSMAAKSSIRDTGRVLQLSLPETDRLAKLLPDISLKELFSLPENTLKEKLKNADDFAHAKELISISKEKTLEGRTLAQAVKVEGSLRNTGIHACGIIITPGDLTDFVPVALAKGSDMWCTQFDNDVAESAGLLKMDFLGLKTLTLIKDAVTNIRQKHGITIDPDALPLDDEKTYALFQRGETVGIFQYESAGMQKYLRDLKPTTFGDLIAMNALYRPGPLEYIPAFIRRKHGKEPILFDLAECEEYLSETYGITVYQEQVMLLSQKLAGFTKGKADTLRKAMGKKKKEELDPLKGEFMDGCAKNGHDPVKCNKIWTDWEAFASYAFNKSHSTCYAWIAYQTAWLKANYPAEYMAAVLSNNMSDIKQVGFFMEECKRMGVPVLGPDVNESWFKFAVNDKGAIRFGLGAMKGVGEGAVNSIVRERQTDGQFKTIFDFASRISLKDCSKRVFESLALGGGFDTFDGLHRAQYFAIDDKGRTLVENAIRYGSSRQNAAGSAQADLFGEASNENIMEPPVLSAEPWGELEKLKREKEVVSMFISGHPLDNFRFEIKHFCQKGGLALLNEMPELAGKGEQKFAGIVTSFERKTSANGKPYGRFMLEDFDSSFEFVLFGDEYLNFEKYFQPDIFVMIRGSVQASKFRQGQFEFRISGMELLENVREKMVKELIVRLPLNDIDETVINDMKAIIEQNSGKVTFKLEVTEEGRKIRFFSGIGGITPTPGLLDYFESLENVNISLN